jgi:hypothetical protein
MPRISTDVRQTAQARMRVIATGTNRTYDVSPDGQRFLMIKENAGSGERDAPPASMVVVQNWFEELKAKVAGK